MAYSDLDLGLTAAASNNSYKLQLRIARKFLSMVIMGLKVKKQKTKLASYTYTQRAP